MPRGRNFHCDGWNETMAHQHGESFIQCLVDRVSSPALSTDEALKQQLLMTSMARQYLSSEVENFLHESPEQVPHRSHPHKSTCTMAPPRPKCASLPYFHVAVGAGLRVHYPPYECGVVRPFVGGARPGNLPSLVPHDE